MTPIEIIVNKLRRLDKEAADYVLLRYNEGTLNRITERSQISALFTWLYTPQGHEYWRDLHYKYIELPKLTPLGNSL